MKKNRYDELKPKLKYCFLCDGFDRHSQCHIQDYKRMKKKTTMFEVVVEIKSNKLYARCEGKGQRLYHTGYSLNKEHHVVDTKTGVRY